MKKIFVAGHKGMVGAAICRKLSCDASNHVFTAPRDVVDLTRQIEVGEFFNENHFDEVYIAAARVGGIFANSTYPADFIYQNLMIQSNIIHSAYLAGVKKLLFLGSSCIYPREAEQPMSEGALLTGILEPTNEPYAIAKIAGIKMCESYRRQYGVDYRSVMPTNLYGPGDNFHPEHSHVIPSLMRRLHEAKVSGAKTVSVWGSGNAKREFLHVDDMADACLYVMTIEEDKYIAKTDAMLSHINVGVGVDCTIARLAASIAQVVGYDGVLVFDTSKPDGAPRKLLDISKLKSLGWEPRISLIDGLASTYNWYLECNGDLRV